MATSNSNITFKGSPLPVDGQPLSVGTVVPDFSLVGTDMQPVTLNNFKGKVVVICAVPSLDTPVCATETKRFNQEATSLSEDVVVLTVSRDLPFAQKRWCAAEGVDRVVCASDYKDRTFGEAFGVDARTLGLLARAVFVVDKNGKVAYVEYVPEIAEEPDYDAIIAKAKELL